MRILSFDTSGNAIHLAVQENECLIAERTIVDPEQTMRQEAVARLMPAVVEIISDVHWHKDDLDCIVVGEGPGSFTGIRTAIVTARTLAQSLNLPVIAVALMDCFCDQLQLPGAVVVSSGRGRYFVSGYRIDADAIVRSPEPTATNLSEIDLMLNDHSVWYCDSGSFDELAHKKSGQPAELKLLPIVENIAVKQAEIAWNRLSLKLNENREQIEKGGEREVLKQCFPYQLIKPMYLRSPSVTLKESPAKSAHGN